jgi:hypothetical protein
MPRVTRNFWLEADIDGRRIRLEGGPQGRDNGFSLTIYIRDNGSVLRAVSVNGIAHSDGTLAISTSAASDVAHSQTGHVEPGSAGFTVTTQAGYTPRPSGRSSSAARTRELLSNPPAAPCRYLDNEVSSREECGCPSCTLVLEAEAAREADSPLGTDPFGRPYTSA